MAKRLKTHTELLASGWHQRYKDTYYEIGAANCPGLIKDMIECYPNLSFWTWTDGMFIDEPETQLGVAGRSSQLTKVEYVEFIDTVFNQMRELIRAKNSDYTAGSDDPFANFRQSVDFGVDPLAGLMVRVGDKLQRIKSFTKNGKLEVVDEGVEDAFRDLIGYSLIALGMLKEKTNANTEA